MNIIPQCANRHYSAVERLSRLRLLRRSRFVIFVIVCATMDDLFCFLCYCPNRSGWRMGRWCCDTKPVIPLKCITTKVTSLFSNVGSEIRKCKIFVLCYFPPLVYFLYIGLQVYTLVHTLGYSHSDSEASITARVCGFNLIKQQWRLWT